ncbi:hypothetical protein GCM10011371_18510 [Novosphingobium marinum]|uniref:Uncharacterized protein n=1 Tax=Novosphingobium marinum TaxID=1514948 RepID=A0A7Z0BW76_9SPHN|nr:hypothetical protein [Novosphingobium marinum]NYH95962.1 hypothetical protein [Novosphingobium marinum]GGC31385.1 hypothetical protein GCM10011371_18510 [Novosphingobium marinum]
MDLNLEYAAHQRALMGADAAANDDDRLAKLAKASRIAGRISDFQHGLGAAAACAWSNAHLMAPSGSMKGLDKAI